MGKENKIYQARQAAGLSRAAMARELKIPARTIEDWEAEKRTPPEYVEMLIIEKLERISMKELAKSEVRTEVNIFSLQEKDYFDGREILAACGYQFHCVYGEENKDDGMIYISEYYKVIFKPGDFDYTEGKDEEYNSSLISWEYAIPADFNETLALKWDNGYWHEVSARGDV